jgi:hypothetical protein
MALIVRIDVDRPYGRHPAPRHLLSRVSSDLYFPRVERFGYLAELATILRILNSKQRRSYAFFRRCTVPSRAIMKLLDDGGHELGLHLENSRSYETFAEEKFTMESEVGRKMLAFSKHGSGGAKYGLRHYAPYEADRYIEWGKRAHMRVFLGNLEDPTLPPSRGELVVYPSAFWLEPSWRDTKSFSIEWLIENAAVKDIVLLIHPENILENPVLTKQFTELLSTLETTLIHPAN